MNLVNTQIRILYNIFIGIFMFIIGILITHIFKMSIGYEIALIFIIELIVLQFLYKKMCLKNGDTNKKILITIGASIVVSPIIYLLFSSNIYIVVVYNLFLSLALVLTRSFLWDIYQYNEYVIMIQIYIIIDLIILIILRIAYKSVVYNYTVLLMLSLLISAILLRQSRNNENGIVSSFDVKFNILIIVISMFSLTQWFQNTSEIVIKALYNLCQYIFDVVMKVINWILTPLINFLQRNMKISNKTLELNTIIKETIDEKDKIAKLQSIARQENFKKIWNRIVFILTIIFIILAIILIGILIYNFVKKIKNNKKLDYTKEYYEIEKIGKKTKNKANKLPKLIGNSNSMDVRRTYIEFLKFSKKKEVYKSHMTSTAISNAMKIKVDAFSELDKIKDIYNEAKFSDHDISDIKVVEIRNSYKEAVKKDKSFK